MESTKILCKHEELIDNKYRSEIKPKHKKQKKKQKESSMELNATKP